MPFSNNLMNLNLNIQLNDKVDKDQIGDIWTALNKCKNYVENGRRLEYMSWRLWQLKTVKQHHSTSSPAIAHDASSHEVSQHGGPIIKTGDDVGQVRGREEINQQRIIIVDEEDEDYFYSEEEEEEEIQYEFIKMKPRPPTSQRSLLSDLLSKESSSSPPSLSNSTTSSISHTSSLKPNSFHFTTKKEKIIPWQDEVFHDCW
ncbi:hypothetical protein G6F43_012177 [Rhizopus delemar]|nr:hypothetical protein G6F43_012177 [Rhizopus delemar]